jgi:hypothetical protein
MAKARSKPAGIDEHARTIAKAFARGRFPQLTPEVEEFLETRPTDIFAASEGACRHLPPSGDDEALGFGYLFLLQMLLERLRYRADRGNTEAIELIAAFQAALVARAKAGEIDGTMLAYLGGAMQQAKIAASPELVALSADLDSEEEDALLPADVELAFDGLIDASGSDPFVLVGTFGEAAHVLPEEAKIALAGYLAADERPAARAAAVLFLLDPSAAVRRAAAVALAEVASLLSPVDLRRLIAMRNWRPEHERADVDTIIQKARAAGIACAIWDKNVPEMVQASPIDGSAAQLLRFISRAGRKKRMSSILTRNGIADAFCAAPQTRRELGQSVEAVGDDVVFLDVERSYIDRTVSHHLAQTVAHREVPPFGLLEVAETIGGADWQPTRIDFRKALDELLAELPADQRDPESIESALADSDVLIDLDEIEQSWFEDSSELREKVQSVSRRAREQFTTALLQGNGAIAAHRNRWAELFVRTALWMRQAPDSDELCWPDLALVARAVLEGHDLTRIGLMRNIAERTVAALSNEPDPW